MIDRRELCSVCGTGPGEENSSPEGPEGFVPLTRVWQSEWAPRRGRDCDDAVVAKLSDVCRSSVADVYPRPDFLVNGLCSVAGGV